MISKLIFKLISDQLAARLGKWAVLGSFGAYLAAVLGDSDNLIAIKQAYDAHPGWGGVVAALALFLTYLALQMNHEAEPPEIAKMRDAVPGLVLPVVRPDSDIKKN